MAMNNLGRVAMVHRGDYNPAYGYVPLDCCYHDGSTYFCKAATMGNAPPNTTYWVLMSTSASTVDRDAAEAAAQAAAGSATAAANQVTLAENQVALAQGHAATAGDEATAAAGSASAAADSANEALAYKGDAELAASQAAISATSASNSATAAAQSAASVDGPGLYNAIAAHDHSGAVGMGAPIDYEHLQGSPPCPYEVGDILTTINEASPAARWPGTVWAAMAPGRVLVGVDPADTDFDAPGKTGGEKAHALTPAEGSLHDHQITAESPWLFFGGAIATDGNNYKKIAGAITNASALTSSGQVRTGAAGSGAPHNTMPPYETVYRYKRTA